MLYTTLFLSESYFNQFISTRSWRAYVVHGETLTNIWACTDRTTHVGTTLCHRRSTIRPEMMVVYTMTFLSTGSFLSVGVCDCFAGDAVVFSTELLMLTENKSYGDTCNDEPKRLKYQQQQKNKSRSPLRTAWL